VEHTGVNQIDVSEKEGRKREERSGGELQISQPPVLLDEPN